MPVVYTLERVKAEILAQHLTHNPESNEEGLRNCLAAHIETRYEDYIAAWEIRFGRPWTDMSPQEALDLMTKHPKLKGNPGLLSRLLS